MPLAWVAWGWLVKFYPLTAVEWYWLTTFGNYWQTSFTPICPRFGYGEDAKHHTRNCLGHFRRHCVDDGTRTRILRQPHRLTCSTIELHLHIVRFCSLRQTNRTPWLEDLNLSSPDWLLPFTIFFSLTNQRWVHKNIDKALTILAESCSSIFTISSTTNWIMTALFRIIIDLSKQD